VEDDSEILVQSHFTVWTCFSRSPTPVCELGGLVGMEGCSPRNVHSRLVVWWDSSVVLESEA
jgi:hypothetical protein